MSSQTLKIVLWFMAVASLGLMCIFVFQAPCPLPDSFIVEMVILLGALVIFAVMAIVVLGFLSLFDAFKKARRRKKNSETC